MDWKSGLDLLQTYNGAVVALLTFCLFMLNIFSVGVAVYLARENRLLRRAGTDPEVVVYLVSAARYLHVINMVIANVGKGPARNLRMTHDGSAEELTSRRVRIQNMKLFEGWSILPQGERLEFLFGSAFDLLKEPPLRPLTFTVLYEDINRRKSEATFKIDVGAFAGMRAVGSPAEHEIAEALKKIADTMSGWSSGRLKVEMISTAEQEQRDRELDEHLQEMIRVRQQEGPLASGSSPSLPPADPP
jgi:hypothetical protein